MQDTDIVAIVYRLNVIFLTFTFMKKTQKILDAIQYIESLNLTCDELDRLTSEVEDLRGSDYEDNEDI